MLVINSDKNNIYNQHAFPLASRGFTPKIKTSSHADVFFKADQDKEVKAQAKKKYENPVNSKMEYLDAARLTAAAGLVLAGKIALEFIDDIQWSSKSLKQLAIASLAIGGMYAVLTLPKNLYNRKVETFQKKKEMDVYVRSNSAEKRLYERIDEEGQKADNERKEELTGELVKLKTGKNQVPEFVKEYDKKSSDKDDPSALLN